MKNLLPELSGREKDIMSVLWCIGKPLTASDIAENGGSISINTVQAALRSLLKKGYIDIYGITYSGTVLAREYKPIISAEQYAAEQLQSMRVNTLEFSTLSFLDHLVKNSSSDILDELEQVIKTKREEGDK